MLIPRLHGFRPVRLVSFCLALIIALSVTFEAGSVAFATGSLNTESVTLSTSQHSATGVTYTLSFKLGTAGAVQSFSAQACDTASGSCTQSGAASGFSASSSTLATSQGLSGSWTVNTGTASTLKGTASSASSSNTSTTYTMTFGGVVNPTATNSTFFLRITTYSDTGYATPVDTGVVATSTAGQITVTATVDQSLTFTLTAATVALGTLSTASTSSGTSTMSAATNAIGGYAITVNGSTLTGPSTITALSSPTAAATNTPQFGINLESNSSPSISGSANPTGGSGAAATGYNTTNQFKFATGNTVALAGNATNTTTYTVSYIADIDSSIAAGSYSTTLTYICTPTF